MLMLFLVAALPGPEQDMETVGEPPSPEYNYLNLDPNAFVDDPDAPEPDPAFTIRPGVPYTRRGNSNGTATVTFTGRTVVTIRPPRPPIPIRGYSTMPRTSRNPAGWQYTGPDNNDNDIPDDLETEMVDVSND